MPFIWNGIDFKVIKKQTLKRNPDKYDGYVVVRRLYVSALKPNQTEVRKYYLK